MIGERIFSGFPNEERVGYARAAVVDGWVFASGTTGFDPETKQFPEDVETQCENCFRNIERALKEAGSGLADMVRIRVYLADRADFDAVAPIVGRYCREARPANTTVVAGLVDERMKVEIEVTALKERG